VSDNDETWARGLTNKKLANALRKMPGALTDALAALPPRLPLLLEEAAARIESAADNPASVKPAGRESWPELPLPITNDDLRNHLSSHHDTDAEGEHDDLAAVHAEYHDNAEMGGWNTPNAHTHQTDWDGPFASPAALADWFEVANATSRKLSDHVYVEEGWWHPNCKSGQVHSHPDNPTGSWSVANHRACEPVYTRRPVSRPT
jgi:hypothetical protein